MLSKDSVILIKDHIAQKTTSLRYKDHLKAALILLFMYYSTHLVKLSVLLCRLYRYSHLNHHLFICKNTLTSCMNNQVLP